MVTKIQQALDESTVVKHNQNLMDRVGNTRQYDVTFEGHFGGRKILGVIECKDWAKKCGPSVIEAFAKKADNLMANVRIVVSRKGFTKQALKLARNENIGCLSLVPDNAAVCGFHIGSFWKGLLFEWGASKVKLIPSTGTEIKSSFDLLALRKNELSIVGWFIEKINTEFENAKDAGEYRLRIDFYNEEIFTIDGLTCELASIEWIINRTVQYKSKWVNWSGEAFYDWELQQLNIPHGFPLKSDPVETDVRNWKNMNNERAKLITAGFSCEFVNHMKLDMPSDIKFTDLSSLGSLWIKTPTSTWTLR